MRASRFAAAAAAVLLIAIPKPASATHDLRLFELEGNPADGSRSGHDWASHFPRDRASGEIAKVFVADGADAPADTSYFTGGGSKDQLDVTEWRHDTGDVAPDKNEITNAYAVAYRSARDTGRNDQGDLIVYFGLDRFANNGDAQVGFWFFRGDVSMGAGGRFTGTHRVGDILVLSDFTQGGRVGDVKVYRWVGSGGSDGSLDLLAAGEDCGDVSDDEPVCAVENTSAIASPWPYEPKSGPDDVFPQGSFYEGGINVSRLVPGVRCLSSFMAETRSSQSVGAQLKDLALGPFDTCPPPVRAASRSPVRARAIPAAAPASRPASPRKSSGGTLPASGAETTVPAVVGLMMLASGVSMRRKAGRS